MSNIRLRNICWLHAEAYGAIAPTMPLVSNILSLSLSYILASTEGSIRRSPVAIGQSHATQHAKHFSSGIWQAFQHLGRSLYPWEMVSFINRALVAATL